MNLLLLFMSASFKCLSTSGDSLLSSSASSLICECESSCEEETGGASEEMGVAMGSFRLLLANLGGLADSSLLVAVVPSL